MSGSTHEAVGGEVLIVWPDGEARVRAHCPNPKDAKEAARLLNRAYYVQDKFRKYTEAARCIAKAEALPGFKWVGADAAGYAPIECELAEDNKEDNAQADALGGDPWGQ